MSLIDFDLVQQTEGFFVHIFLFKDVYQLNALCLF